MPPRDGLRWAEPSSVHANGAPEGRLSEGARARAERVRGGDAREAARQTSSRAASSSIAMSASMNWMAWNSAMGLPN